MTQLASGQAVNTERDREKALDLRAEGYTYQEIADKLTIAKSWAYDLVRQGLDAIRDDNKLRAAQLRDLEARRLDKVRLALWDKRAHPDVANAITRISARMAALYGLDAPKKIEQSGPDGGPIRFEGNKVQLTDSERRRRLQEIGLTGILPAFIATNGNGEHREN